MLCACFTVSGVCDVSDVLADDISALVDKACALKFEAACTTITMKGLDKGVDSSELTESLALLKKQCDDENGVSCFRLGGLYFEGKLADLNKIQAYDLFLRACSLRVPTACGSAGLMERDGIARAVNDFEAVTHFQAGCDLGDVESCVRAARLIHSNPNIRKAFPKRRTLAQKACRINSAEGCFLLGLYLRDTETPSEEDLKLSFESYSKEIGRAHV